MEGRAVLVRSSSAEGGVVWPVSVWVCFALDCRPTSSSISVLPQEPGAVPATWQVHQPHSTARLCLNLLF